MKKAFFIDAVNKTITAVEIPATKPLPIYYWLLKCDRIDVASAVEAGVKDDLIIDDEGMFNAENFILVKGIGQQVFAGSGILIGYDPKTGDSTNVHMTLEEAMSRVAFFTPAQAREYTLQHNL